MQRKQASGIDGFTTVCLRSTFRTPENEWCGSQVLVSAGSEGSLTVWTTRRYVWWMYWTWGRQMYFYLHALPWSWWESDGCHGDATVMPWCHGKDVHLGSDAWAGLSPSWVTSGVDKTHALLGPWFSLCKITVVPLRLLWDVEQNGPCSRQLGEALFYFTFLFPPFPSVYGNQEADVFFQVWCAWMNTLPVSPQVGMSTLSPSFYFCVKSFKRRVHIAIM